MRRGVFWREVFIFAIFFILGPVIWVMASGSNPARAEGIFRGLLDLEVRSIFATLVPYLVFQLLRVLIFGLGRKV